MRDPNGIPRTARDVRRNVYPGTIDEINRAEKETSKFVISVTEACAREAYPTHHRPVLLRHRM